MIRFPQHFRDGVVLPKGDPMALFKDKKKYNAVPVIFGSNRDESKLFMVANPKYTKRYFGMFIKAKDWDQYELIARYNSDIWKAKGVDEVCSVLRETQGANVYAYRFDWDEEPRVLWMDFSALLGAAHLLEVPFVFGIFETNSELNRIFTEKNFPGRKALSDSMQSYWAEFAYSGAPGKGRDGKALEWKAWDNSSAESDKYLILDTPQDQGILMSSETIMNEDMKKRLLNEKGFAQQKTHCEMYVRFFRGTGLWDEMEYKHLGLYGCEDYPPASVDPF